MVIIVTNINHHNYPIKIINLKIKIRNFLYKDKLVHKSKINNQQILIKQL